MSISALKKTLKSLEKEEIIGLIADLYKNNKSVKEFFDFYINPNEVELLEKYRLKVYEAFYPKRGFKFQPKIGKQAISDFKKLGTSRDLLADLMLFYVEVGVHFIIDFGDIGDAFYRSLASTFIDSLTLMQKENVLEKFEERVSKLIKATEETHWGFYEYMAAIWIDFYPSPDDNIIDDESE